MNTFSSLTEKLLQDLGSAQAQANCRISYVIKENFETWENTLIPELKGHNMPVYKTLQGVFKEMGITVSESALMNAMTYERKKRAGAAKNGSSKGYSKGAANAANPPQKAGQADTGPSVTPTIQNTPKPATAGVTLENYTGPVEPGSKPPYISGQGGSIAWEMKAVGVNDYEVIFDGQTIPYLKKNIGQVLMPVTQKLYKLKDVEGMIEVLHFLQDFLHTFAGYSSLGRGLTLKPLTWPQGETTIVKVLQDDIAALSL